MNKEQYLKIDSRLREAVDKAVKKHKLDPRHVQLFLLISSLRVFLTNYQMDHPLTMARFYLKSKVEELIDGLDCTELAALAKIIENSADPDQALKNLVMQSEKGFGPK